jgi:hypothetical protein
MNVKDGMDSNAVEGLRHGAPGETMGMVAPAAKKEHF